MSRQSPASESARVAALPRVRVADLARQRVALPRRRSATVPGEEAGFEPENKNIRRDMDLGHLGQPGPCLAGPSQPRHSVTESV